jgi:hypothetical protein
MNETAQSVRQDITIDSNWVITIGMVLLFAFVAFFLGRSVRNLLFDRIDFRFSPGVRSGWSDTLTYAITAVNYLAFAYLFRAKKLKVAFSLLVINYTLHTALPYLHVSAELQHSLAVAGSIASQIAYVIVLFAIVQWFKAVVRRAPPTDREVGDT